MVAISIKNYGKVKKELQSKNERVRKALKNTVRDLAKRAPGWIAAEVAQVYGISKGEVNPRAKKGKKISRLRVKGECVENMSFEYSGRTLTPTHFKMKPTTRKSSKVPGQISAEIFKGKRKLMHKDVFLGGNKGGGWIPFQRTSDARYPIKARKTLSVPQMVSNAKVSEGIQEKLTEGLEKRFDHHMSKV